MIEIRKAEHSNASGKGQVKFCGRGRLTGDLAFPLPGPPLRYLSATSPSSGPGVWDH